MEIIYNKAKERCIKSEPSSAISMGLALGRATPVSNGAQCGVLLVLVQTTTP